MSASEVDMLRLSTLGSVDDGKSTLIGRLLFDTRSIFEDQLSAVERSTARRGQEGIDFALLTDGLRAEREQGITIDVAYRYFATPRRKFIVADTPGHHQYTRNMVTGASTSELALLLVDARKGLSEQTCRHALLASLLQVKHLVLVVNKMDLMGWEAQAFHDIVRDFESFCARLEVDSVSCIPVCALHGDNVVERSERLAWYEGPTLLYALETAYVAGSENYIDARLPVQLVIRPRTAEQPDFRGVAGQIASGVFRPGDEVVVLPSGFESRVAKIFRGEEELDEAFPPHSVCMTLETELDVSRGDMIAKVRNRPTTGQDLDVMLCWFSERVGLRAGGKYLLRHSTQLMPARVQEVVHTVDAMNLGRVEAQEMKLNDVGRVILRTARPVMYDAYAKNRRTGGLILVDPGTNETVAAGMIRGAVR